MTSLGTVWVHLDSILIVPTINREAKTCVIKAIVIGPDTVIGTKHKYNILNSLQMDGLVRVYN